ncbi:hypothetical protein JCM3770_005180 [Rhodotorula araucariae]
MTRGILSTGIAVHKTGRANILHRNSLTTPSFSTRQPPGFAIDSKEDYVYELKGAAYGLPQSGPTLCIGRRDADYVLFLAYVDDGLVGGKKELVKNLMGNITKVFDIEFKGLVTGCNFLGREIEHDPTTRRLAVCVTAQIDKVLKRHNLEDLKPLHMPIQHRHQAGARPSPATAAVGLLIFIATTRQFAVGVASRYSTNPSPEHWKLVTCIYTYLSAMRDIGLVAGVQGVAPCSLGSRRSTSGVAIFLHGSLISSSSKRQLTVALSMFVAELKAIAKGVTDLEWYESILCTLPIGSDTPICVYSDHKSAVNQLLLPACAEMRKTVNVKVKYVQR